MRRLPSRAIPLQGEPVEFRGGPMDGFVSIMGTHPLKPHVYWRNPSGRYDVYVLVETVLGWHYAHRPEAVILAAPTTGTT